MSVGYVEAHHRGTRCVLNYAIDTSNPERISRFLMAVTVSSGNAGEWIVLTEDRVHWSYIAEKMPHLAKYDGDKEGWVEAFAAVGIEVFG